MTKRKRLFLLLTLILLILISYLAIINLISPYIINILLDSLNEDYGLLISIQKHDLSLVFSYIMFSGIEVKYRESVILRADMIRLDLEYMIMLLFKELNIKQINIKGLDIFYSPEIEDLIDSLSQDPERKDEDQKKGFSVYISSVVVQNSSINYVSDEISVSVRDISLKLFSYLGMYYETNLKFSAHADIKSQETIDYFFDLNMLVGKNFDTISIPQPKDYNIVFAGSESGRLSGDVNLKEGICDINVDIPLPAYIFTDMSGTAVFEADIYGPIDYPDFRGMLYTMDFSFDKTNLDLNALFEKKGDNVLIEKISIISDMLSGTIHGNINLGNILNPQDEETLTEAGNFGFQINEIDTNALILSQLKRESAFHQTVSMAGTGRIYLSDSRLIPDLTGSIDITKNEEGYSPLYGSILVSYRDGYIEVDCDELIIDDSMIRISAGFEIESNEIDGHFTYQINNASNQHSFIRTLVISEILAGNPEDIMSFLEFWDINKVDQGEGIIDGTIKGYIQNPVIESEIEGKDVIFSNTFLGNIKGFIRYYDEEIVLEDTIISMDESFIMANGFIDLKKTSPKLIELSLEADRYPAYKILDIYEIDTGLDLDQRSTVTGPVLIDSRKSDVIISFPGVHAENIAFNSIYIGDMIAEGIFEEEKLSFSHINLKANQGTANAKGSYSFNEGTFFLEFTSKDFSIFDQDTYRNTAGIDNALISMDLSLGGSLDNLNVSADGLLHHISKNGEILPDLIFDILIEENNGTFSFQVDKNIAVRGNIHDLTNFDFEGDIIFKDLIHFANIFSEDDVEDILIPLAGNLKGNFDANDLDSLFVQFYISTMAIDFMRQRYTNQDTIKIVYYNQQLLIKDFILKTGKNLFRISGIVDPVLGYDLNLQSDMDISFLSQFLPSDIFYTMRGDSEVYLDIFGELSNPLFKGYCRIHNGFIRLADVTYPLSNIDIEMLISGTNINVRSLSARFNQGIISAGGDILFSVDGIENILLNIAGSDVRYTMPKVFDTRFNSQLKFTGNSEKGFILSGDINLDHFNYMEKMDLTSKLSNMIRGIITGRATYDVSSFQPDEIVTLDLKVSGTRNLTMDNDLGKVFFRADLNIRGYVSNPVILGRAEIISGTLYLLDNTFTDIRGNLEFINPFRLDPNINFSGKTIVSGYNITVALSGTLENPVLDLSSNPPLTEIDILSLLGTGRTTQDLMAGQGQARFGEYGISTLLTSGITSYLEKTAQDLFKFDRITIAPILSGSQSDLSAKITIEKRLSNRLFLLYSFSTSYGEEQVAILKYEIIKNINAIIQRSEFGSIGGDIQFGLTFD